VLGAEVLGDAGLGRAALDDDGLDVNAGTEALGVPAVPRAAGIDGDGRGVDDAALRGAAAGLGDGDGANIAITIERPTNPVATAAMPYTISILSDMPCRPDGGA
jgi:hypothetical protein